LVVRDYTIGMITHMFKSRVFRRQRVTNAYLNTFNENRILLAVVVDQNDDSDSLQSSKARLELYNFAADELSEHVKISNHAFASLALQLSNDGHANLLEDQHPVESLRFFQRTTDKARLRKFQSVYGERFTKLAMNAQSFWFNELSLTELSNAGSADPLDAKFYEQIVQQRNNDATKYRLRLVQANNLYVYILGSLENWNQHLHLLSLKEMQPLQNQMTLRDIAVMPRIHRGSLVQRFDTPTTITFSIAPPGTSVDNVAHELREKRSLHAIATESDVHRVVEFRLWQDFFSVKSATFRYHGALARTSLSDALLCFMNTAPGILQTNLAHMLKRFYRSYTPSVGNLAAYLHGKLTNFGELSENFAIGLLEQGVENADFATFRPDDENLLHFNGKHLEAERDQLVTLFLIRRRRGSLTDTGGQLIIGVSNDMIRTEFLETVLARNQQIFGTDDCTFIGISRKKSEQTPDPTEEWSYTQLPHGLKMQQKQLRNFRDKTSEDVDDSEKFDVFVRQLIDVTVSEEVQSDLALPIQPLDVLIHQIVLTGDHQLNIGSSEQLIALVEAALSSVHKTRRVAVASNTITLEIDIIVGEGEIDLRTETLRRRFFYASREQAERLKTKNFPPNGEQNESEKLMIFFRDEQNDLHLHLCKAIE